MKTIVIGAGVVGSGVAYRLAEAGSQVTIIEADRVGGGTSGVSYAWVNSSTKPPRAYHDLNVGGMKAHAALADEFGAAPWFHKSGAIEWRSDCAEREAQMAKVERLKSWGYTVDFITRNELAEMEPDLDILLVGDAPITFCPEEGWLDPVVYANAMVKAAQKLGAVLKVGSPVVDVIVAGGVVKGVKTADGETHEADMVVNCAGRWSDRVSENPDTRLPLDPTAGFLVFTPPVATSVSHLIHTSSIDVRPDGAGRLMLHKRQIDDELTLEDNPTPEAPQTLEIMRRASVLIPGLAGVPAEAVRVTARALPQDGFSAVGLSPRLDNYYFVVTHSGVTLSPFLAKLVADEIVHGAERAELADFRPNRFYN